AGASVVLFVAPSGSGEVLTQPGGVTDANGDVVGSLTSTITGPRVVTAEVEGAALSDTVTIVFVPGPVAQFQWTGDGSAVAGVTEQITLSVFDDRGNLKTNYTGSVSLSTTADSVTWAAPDAFGTINQTGGDTADYVFAAADSGVATLRVTNRVAGSYAVTAQDGSAIETSSPIVVDHAAADRVLLIAGDGQSVEVNTPVNVPAAVRVTDAYGNAVDNEIVAFRVLTGGGTLDAIAGGGVDSTRATDVTGQVQCDLWTMGVTAGVDANTMRALISSGAVPSVDFTATSVPGPGANLVLTPGTKSVTVGATEVVTASLTDLYNNAVSGERVDVFIKSPASGTLIGNGADPNPTSATSTTSRFGATDALGNVTVVFTASTTAGVSDVLDALSTNVAQSGVADVVYTTTAAGGATNLRITLLSSTAVAGTSFQFVVDAVDGNGNVDPGNAALVDLTGQAGSGIVFSLTDGGAAVTQVTLSSGSITLYGRGDISGGWDITASNGGLGPGMSGITITDTGVVASYVATTVGTAVAGTSFDVSVEARDAFGNRVMAAANTINLAAVDGADSTQVASTSLLTLQAALSAGQAVVSEAYAVAETIRVRITDASANSGFTAGLIITPSMATRVAAESGDSTGVIAGNTQVLVARVYDPFNNPVSGVPVTFTPMGGGSVVPATGATDALGRMTTAFTTDVVAGENRVRVTIDDGLPPALEQAEFTVGTIAGPIDYYRVIPARLGIEAGEVIPLDIFAYDINNNLATPDSTTTIDITSDASATFGASTGTLTGGVFATTMTDTVSGIVTVSVETSGIPSQSGSSSPVTVSHALEYRVARAGGDTTGVTVGSVQLLAVKVSDRYGNDVANALVIFQVDPPGGIDGTAFIRDSVADSTDGITVTDAAALEKWIAAMDAVRPLDLVIANAGISGGTDKAAGGEGADQARRIFAVNLHGVINTVMPAITLMR
ncbi:MAG: Ig-like domain-containing protein, partial [Candidatus Krumholzibacteriota bacterium]|nr:Ig-like domain-containing protein [Candidatus Krumholzibacteriota bacterium]